MGQVIVNEETAHETAEFISKRLGAIKNQRISGEQEDLALIIGWLRFLHGIVIGSADDLHCRWQEFDVCTRKGGVQVVFGVGVVV